MGIFVIFTGFIFFFFFGFVFWVGVFSYSLIFLFCFGLKYRAECRLDARTNSSNTLSHFFSASSRPYPYPVKERITRMSPNKRGYAVKVLWIWERFGGRMSHSDLAFLRQQRSPKLRTTDTHLDTRIPAFFGFSCGRSPEYGTCSVCDPVGLQAGH